MLCPASHKMLLSSSIVQELLQQMSCCQLTHSGNAVNCRAELELCLQDEMVCRLRISPAPGCHSRHLRRRCRPPDSSSPGCTQIIQGAQSWHLGQTGQTSFNQQHDPRAVQPNSKVGGLYLHCCPGVFHFLCLPRFSYGRPSCHRHPNQCHCLVVLASTIGGHPF